MSSTHTYGKHTVVVESRWLSELNGVARYGTFLGTLDGFSFRADYLKGGRPLFTVMFCGQPANASNSRIITNVLKKLLEPHATSPHHAS
jgi:hypothetical protein